MSLEIEYLSIDAITPNDRNSRTHSKEQVAQICDSIKEFGFTNPILIDEDNIIIAGHGRLEAAKKLGETDVPTITLVGLTDDQKRAYVIADNKLALNAGWDMAVLQEEVNRLADLDFNLDLLGFDSKELADIRGLSADDESDYTKKVETPLYEPSEEKPDLTDLFDDSKTFELVEAIKASKLPQAEKDFLMLAAGRHTVLDFEKIADYYAHSSEEMQSLMEDSALVIIDFDKAIEQGYITMSQEISETYLEDYPNEG